MIRIITSLVAVLTVTSIQAQTTLSETPKLVIGITIDQLRGDYLNLFQSSFTERGFKQACNSHRRRAVTTLRQWQQYIPGRRHFIMG